MVTKLVAARRQSRRRLAPLREGRKATPQATFSEALKVMKYKGVWKLLGLRKKLSPIHKCYYFIHEKYVTILNRKSSSKHNGFALFGC